MTVSGALALRSLGLSVLPLLPGSKAPLHKAWTPYQQCIASEDEIASWPEDANIGVIAGAVSGSLLVDDIDYLPFVLWILEQPLVEVLPYLVETGSHKLHIYMRTQEGDDLHGENIDIDGIHYGEIRGNGQYVVAPPSQVRNEADHVQAYRYLKNDRIPLVPDARALFHSLLSTYLKRRPTQKPPSQPIAAPLSGAELERKIERAQGLGRELRQTILRGPRPGKGIWRHLPSYSQVDFAVVENLIRCNFTDQEIEAIFAEFPVGEHCYQNTSRQGSMGPQYMALTLKSAHKKMDKIIVAAKEAQGDNFRVLRVVKKLYDEAIYEIVVETENVGQPPVKFECLGPEIISEAMFRKKLAGALDYIPQFAARGKDYEKFADSILRLAEIEEVPETAKQSGFLRAFLLDQIRRTGQILPEKPPNHNGKNLGFVDSSNGHTYLDGVQLVHLVTLNPALRPTPKPGDIWEILRRWGGEEVEVRFDETDIVEDMWALPSEVLKENR